MSFLPAEVPVEDEVVQASSSLVADRIFLLVGEKPIQDMFLNKVID